MRAHLQQAGCERRRNGRGSRGWREGRRGQRQRNPDGRWKEGGGQGDAQGGRSDTGRSAKSDHETNRREKHTGIETFYCYSPSRLTSINIYRR